MKIDWKIKNGLINKLFLDKNNIILPWGFETSDSYSFYSQETKGKGNIEKKCSLSSDNKKNNVSLDVEMKEGEWHLEIEEIILKNQIQRSHKLITIEDSFFFDFVQRYRFKKEFFHTGIINGKTITHQNSNIYYQFNVSTAELKGDKIRACINLVGGTSNELFWPVLYIRDYRDEWIVHVRLWPKKWDKEVLKLCTFWYDKALPEKVGNFLLRIPIIKDYTWIRGERAPYKRPMSLLSPCSYPEVKIKKGEILYLESNISFFEI